jgi:hypothetical protein
MKLYAYCLAEGMDVLEESVRGIANEQVRVLTRENLSVLVSDLNAGSVPVTRENALAHARVVQSVLDRTTPLPFRFGTIVTDQQLQHYMSARKPAIETKLAQVRGCVEMGVKIIWENSQSQPAESEPDGNQGAGTNFLEEKRRRILGDEQDAAKAAEIAEWLHRSVADLIKNEQVTARPAAKLVLSAAHLVERANIASYRERVAQTSQKRPELHFLLSGPWPPYSFANIELEFKSQFGVS